MVVVDGITSLKVHKEAEEEIAREPTQEELESSFLEQSHGELTLSDVEFTKPSGKVRRGFYMDGYL